MRTRDATDARHRRGRWLASLCPLALCVACDGGTKSHYGDKSYGLPSGTDLDATAKNGDDDDIVIEPGVDGFDPETDSGDAKTGSETASHTTTATTTTTTTATETAGGGDDGGSGGSDAGQAGGADEADGGEVVDEGDDGADGDPTPLPPETLIKNALYRARFDQDSAVGIRDSSGYRTLGALVAGRIRDNLVTTRDDGLTAKQTYGDGIARSVTVQEVRNSAGDASRGEDGPSASGTRILDRIVSADCPGVFLCIERMVVKPTTGDPSTICFADKATGVRKPFPFGAVPNYKAADFAAAYGSYGPYRISAYAGDDVDCDAPGTPLVTEEIGVEVSQGSLDAAGLELRTDAPVPAQYSVVFETHRLANDLVAPYVDETILLNHKTNYLMNEDEAELVKLVVTTRMSVDIAAQAGGGILGGLAGLLVNLDGVSVDLHMELCQNQLDPADPDHCPP
jgi:hypothetical protein